MNYSFYLLLTQSFCEANADYQVGVSRFGYAVTNDGRYVTSTNTLNDFPELFNLMNPFPPIIMLADSEFPVVDVTP